MKKIAILGCGNIGSIIAGRSGAFEVSAVYDQLADCRCQLAELTGATDCPEFEALLDQPFDLLIEAASIDAVRQFAPQALARGRDIVILSVGSLANRQLRDELESLARKNDARLHIPSGAVIGLDNLKVGRVSRLDRLLLRTTKSPAALDVAVDARTCIFKGAASDCVAKFPRNINVAMSVSLAAGRECDVEIWADPAAEVNSHQIIAEGEFGRTELVVENVPSPDNPRTSYLAALSVLALIENHDRPLQVGT